MSTGVLDLPVAYRDVRAAGLRLHLALPPQEALRVRSVVVGGWVLDLRILGGSHQVGFGRAGAPGSSETVACHLGDGVLGAAGLPSRHVAVLDGLRYRFRSFTLRPAPAVFSRWVDALATRLSADAGAVCGVFPGDALGLTGVQVRSTTSDGLAWRTWHTYPQTGEVVVTGTSIGLRSPGVAP